MPESMSGIYFAAAIIATMIVIVALKGVAHRFGLVDAPNERKHHEGVIPIHGGLCMGLVIAASGVLLYVTTGLSDAEWFLVLGVSIFGIMGFLDDLFELAASIRLLIELAVLCVMMIFFDFHLGNLGNLVGLGDVELGILAIPFSIFVIFCVINGVNMLDGVDGLAGGIVFVALGCFLVAAALQGAVVSPILLVVAGAIIGFLFFNARSPWRKKANVFMGDAGSLILGFTLCWCSIAFTQGGGENGQVIMYPMTAVWILALPVIDTVYVVIHRAREGIGIFTPGRDHIHHRLLQLGFSESITTYLLWLVTAILGSVGLAANYANVPEIVMCTTFVGMSALYYLVASRMQRKNAIAE